MKITCLHKEMYMIEDVFSDESLASIDNLFSSNVGYSRYAPQGDFSRLEIGFKPLDPAISHLRRELAKVRQFIVQVTGQKHYRNPTQLWKDEIGYQNWMHTDQSNNIHANCQIYLSEGSEDMGTSAIMSDYKTYTAPYVYNGGYILLNPTKNRHGMLAQSTTTRISLYQSYRTNIKGISDW